MFIRHNLSQEFEKIRADNFHILSQYTIEKISILTIRTLDKKYLDSKDFYDYKCWVLFKWVKQNFAITESFVAKLKKLVKKLKIIPRELDNKFIRQLEELVFTTWRPLKDFPVKFKLDGKDKIKLLQLNNYFHFYINEKDVEQIGRFDFYYSQTQIYITTKNQIIKHKIKYSSIFNVICKTYGTILDCGNVKYLIRGQNKLLVYIIISRMVPTLNLDINNISNLLDYFSLWNNLKDKIY
ncbi:hypothetical protein [Spiroplasma endosymbiont of Crioceris asparagi]|uniref:hypothetical protein n=1 Tax=Spiroplasma endosymbiont of Crioceris asparagi TaxID=3066286 RepID=UPI0030CCE51F